MNEEDLKLLFSDIETLRRYILLSFWDCKTNVWYEFRINKYQNDLAKFVKFCERIRKEYDYTVYFNGLKFDMQIIEYILENAESWSLKPWHEVCERIYQFSQYVIKLTNGEQFPPYREDQFSYKIIDVFEIPHFSNKNKRTSLKWLEFMMNMDDIEEMPIHHTEVEFTKESIAKIDHYCRHDIIATHLWYLHLTGRVEHPFYKDNNKIQDRLDLIEEGLLPIEAINYSDAKIGDELNKRTYCKLTGRNIKDLYELKKKRGGTTPFTFGDAIPEYVSFQTPELRAFFARVSKISVKLSLKKKDKQEFPLTFRGTNYLIAKGGIHSTEKGRQLIALVNEYLEDADVGAQYPNAIRKRRLFPKHLGIDWNVVGVENISKKDDYKQKGKTTKDEALKRKYKGLEKTYKLALNAGYFGKTIDDTNWQYGPEVGLFCTIGNQFEILMLIEMLELRGIHCVSANTDGIVCLYDKSKEKDYYEVCHAWEKIVGNEEMGKLEYKKFKSLSQESVNCYVGVPLEGETKIKGRFDVEGELNKNNTKDIGRIERKAISEYFAKGTPVEQTIRECEDIWMFCIGLKSSSNYFFRTVHPTTGKQTEHKKVIRFFVSNKGERLLKIKAADADTNGPDISRISKTALVTMFNTRFNADDFAYYDICYEFYINKAEEIVRSIEAPRKNKKYKTPPKEQSNMFE